MVKSNSTDSLRIQRNSRKIGLLAIESWQKTTGINRDKDSIGEKDFPDNSEDLRNAIVPYSQMLQMEKNSENILK